MSPALLSGGSSSNFGDNIAAKAAAIRKKGKHPAMAATMHLEDSRYDKILAKIAKDEEGQPVNPSK